MTKFIFKGLYYPVLGSSVGWVNHKTKCILDRRLGGWENADKWWSFSYGIHCRMFNPDKPYFDFVIKKIDENPEMNIVVKENGYHTVRDNQYRYIGDIRDAYMLSDLSHFTTLPGSEVVCAGWSEKDKKFYGWSHRAMCGFGLDDCIFEEDYGDDSTLFTKHGRYIINSFEDAKKSAMAFASSVS